jgi:hypothetical protein
VLLQQKALLILFRGQSYKHSSSFFKACLSANFLMGFFESYKKFKPLDFLPGAQKKLTAQGHPMA